MEDALLGSGRGCGDGRRHHRRVTGQPAHQSSHGPYHYHGRPPGDAACSMTSDLLVSGQNKSAPVNRFVLGFQPLASLSDTVLCGRVDLFDISVCLPAVWLSYLLITLPLSIVTILVLFRPPGLFDSTLQVFGFLTLNDVDLNGFTIVNLCVMVRGRTSNLHHRPIVACAW